MFIGTQAVSRDNRGSKDTFSTLTGHCYSSPPPRISSIFLCSHTKAFLQKCGSPVDTKGKTAEMGVGVQDSFLETHIPGSLRYPSPRWAMQIRSPPPPPLPSL